jgi:nicotinate-nucleotide pyrophosphorylase (carboxylating)
VTNGGRKPYDDLIALALAEDIGAGDVTTAATIPPTAKASGVMLAKASGVASGMEAAAAVFRLVDPAVRYAPLVNDGARFADRQPLAEVEGPAAAVLAGERTALNLVQRLSAVATLTARFVEAVAGTGARIVDTRKTTPGLRWLEKAAVRHGGAGNHRFNLADGVLIKDNHLAAVGGVDPIGQAVALARANAPHGLKVEVEVTTLAGLDRALGAGADIVLLDNMDLRDIAEAVRRTAGRALLEASGGVTLERVRAIADTGVDLISVGALTHSAGSLDISLEFAISS